MSRRVAPRYSAAPGSLLILLMGSCVILVAVSCLPRQTPGSAPTPARSPGINELQTDIRLLSTLNRLSLSRKQIEELLPMVVRIQDISGAYDQCKQGVQDQLRPLLEQQRAALLKDEAPSSSLQSNVQKLEEELNDLDLAQTAAQQEISDSLRQALTQPQIAILTGASEARVEAAELLTWLREMPGADYKEEAAATAEALATDELGLDAEALLSIFETARDMQADHYRTARKELIDQLAPIYGDTPAAANRALLHIFSNPRMVTILQEKAKSVAQ